MSKYGEEEVRYARPIAAGLQNNPSFRLWFIEQTSFAQYALIARLNDEEQKALRTPGTLTWWRSYWTMKASCHCGNCRERETDLMAVFSNPDGYRFALHVEVKGPHDRFSLDQARDYRSRADCWKGRERAPKRILPHDKASTVLICDDKFKQDNRVHLDFFDTIITFGQIASQISPYPDP